MPYIVINNKIKARCNDCGYTSRYPRNKIGDVPKWWNQGELSNGIFFLRCAACSEEYYEQVSEQEAWASMNW